MDAGASLTQEVKRANRKRVYKAILTKGQCSQLEIATNLDISVPTVTQNVRALMDMGLVSENGNFKSTGGRKAKVIIPETEAYISIGLEITQTHVTLVAANLAADILYEKRIKRTFQAEEEYAKAVQQMIVDAVDSLRVQKHQVLGIGLALTGIIDADNQNIVSVPRLENGERFVQKLKESVSYPLILLNDANAGAFAEVYGKHMSGMVVYLSLSDTVGGAIAIEGKLQEGQGHRCGEFGHMTLVPGGKKCYCGQRGCVDTYCSALQLSEHTDGNLKLFFERLQENDLLYRKIWQEYMEYLCVTIHNLNIAMDCDILLGGYVGWYLSPYLKDIQKRVSELSGFETTGEFVRLTKYNENSAALGAALRFVKEFIDEM